MKECTRRNEILKIVNSNPNGIRQKHVADKIGIPVVSVKYWSYKLEKAGLIKIVEAPYRIELFPVI